MTLPSIYAAVVRSKETTMEKVDQDKHRIKVRLLHVLGWHCEPSDLELSDDEFVKKVFERFQRHSERPLIDPNE